MSFSPNRAGVFFSSFSCICSAPIWAFEMRRSAVFELTTTSSNRCSRVTVVSEAAVASSVVSNKQENITPLQFGQFYHFVNGG